MTVLAPNLGIWLTIIIRWLAFELYGYRF